MYQKADLHVITVNKNWSLGCIFADGIAILVLRIRNESSTIYILNNISIYNFSMKLTFKKQFNPFVFALAGLVFVNSSCSKVSDLSKAPEGGDLEQFIPGGVSAKFGWNTTNTVDVRLGVNDKFDGKYTYALAIFDRVPDAAGATLLGGGTAKSGQDLVTKITVPTGLNYVYVQQTAPNGVVTYSMVEVKSNGIQNTGVAGINKVAAVNARGLNLFAATGAASFASTAAPTVPADATPLKGNNNVTVGNKSYVIAKGDKFTAGLDANLTGATIYVAGTWDNRDFTVPAGNKVVVLAGGTATGFNLLLKGDNAQFVSYGNTKYWELNVTSKSVVSNYGDMVIDNTVVLNNNGTFENAGTANLHMITATGSATVSNSGKLVTKKIKLSGADVTMNVNCNTTVQEQMGVDGSTVIVAEGARLDIQLLDVSEGGQYIMKEGSMLDVTKKIHFSSGKVNTVTAAAGVQNAFLRTGGVTTGYDLAVKYQGNLQVAVDNHPINQPNGKPIYTAEPTVTFVGYAKPTITIAESACNNGGVKAISTNPPGDQKLTEIILGTFSYAFEDNWPTAEKYDYDMNDFVVDVQIIKYQNKDNKVQKVVLKNKIRSIGASRRLAAGVQLDRVLASGVKSVNYSNTKVVGSVLPLTSAGVESGQQAAVVTIVDDAHAAFGFTATTPFIFTNNGTAPIENEITIEFNTPLDFFTYDDLNPFIVNYPTMKAGRHEIHLPGRKGTDKLNKDVVAKHQGAGGELSPLDPFKTKGNYPFAISTPVSFQYPREAQAITIAYPDFINWVTSGGTTNQDWYNNFKK